MQGLVRLAELYVWHHCFAEYTSKEAYLSEFFLDGLRSLPVPHSSYCGIAALAEAYDQHADDMLRPLPEVHTDPVRHALDDAVLKAVPGLPPSDVARWRKSISLEPSVNNEKDPFSLS